MKNKDIIEKLYKNHTASKEELLFLLETISCEEKTILQEKANHIREKHYGKDVYLRGLIEFTNYCKRNCAYCGINIDNSNIERYRLDKKNILECCDIGNKLGYKTFVLQGGEDDYYSDEIMVEIVSAIKEKYPDNAITLSIGERSHKSYERLYKAGAERYLLRHETSNGDLYKKLHPGFSLEKRVESLKSLQSIGYKVGGGFLVGIPGGTKEDLVNDLLLIKSLNLSMCGIGPFIPHKDTKLKNYPNGSIEDTIVLIAIIRLLLPKVLIPATTAVATVDLKGREKALKSGANVIMPNLSPKNVRSKYLLYNGKVATGEEAAESKKSILKSVENSGYKVIISKGNPIE